MPLRWIICPVSTQLVPVDECLACAASYRGQTTPGEDPADPSTRRMCNFRYPYLRAITSHDRGRPTGASASMLSGCVRQSVWKATRDYAITPRESHAATSGTAWHDYLQQFNEPGVIAERRLRYVLADGRVLTGQLDRLVPLGMDQEGVRTQYVIEDYKRKEDGKLFTSSPDYYTIQLNTYRLMIERGCTDLTTGEKICGEVVGMTLLPSSHSMEGRPVEVPPIPLDQLEQAIGEYFDLFTAAMEGNALPPRHEDSSRSYFCRTFCPFHAECLQAGGPIVQPLRQLVKDLGLATH